jgi:ubiquinone biosynthesis protein COQ9
MVKKASKKKSVDKTKLALAIAQAAGTHGWSEAAMQAGAVAVGIGRGELRLYFSRGVRDAVEAFSNWADDQMLLAVKKTKNFERFRVREKIGFAVQARLQALTPYRDAVKNLLSWAALPMHVPFALQQMYKTTDAMWRAAGDTATDFNHYTKRGLLAFVLKTTTFFWLHDSSKGQAKSWEFLERRIAEVLKIGQTLGAAKNFDLLGLAANFFKRAA